MACKMKWLEDILVSLNKKYEKTLKLLDDTPKEVIIEKIVEAEKKDRAGLKI